MSVPARFMVPAHCPLLNASINFPVTFFCSLQLYKIELLAMQIHTICICRSPASNKCYQSTYLVYLYAKLCLDFQDTLTFHISLGLDKIRLWTLPWWCGSRVQGQRQIWPVAQWWQWFLESYALLNQELTKLLLFSVCGLDPQKHWITIISGSISKDLACLPLAQTQISEFSVVLCQMPNILSYARI